MPKDNNHYVHQGYLRGFTIEGEKSLVWEYDKHTGKISHQPKSVRDICSSYQYYAQNKEDGSIDNETIENAFQYIEDKASRLIRNIEVSRDEIKINLNEEQRETLSFFTSMQFFRVPNFRDGIEGMHRRAAEIVLDMIIDDDRRKGILPEKIKELYEDDGIKINVENSVSLEPMINLAEKGAINILHKVWYFSKPAEGMTFITSDNPVYFQAPEKYRNQVGSYLGPLHPLAEVTLPLRKDLLFVISPSVEFTKEQYELLNCRVVQLDKVDTKNMNKRTSISAARYIYSCEKSEALARMIGKLKGTSQRLVV